MGFSSRRTAEILSGRWEVEKVKAAIAIVGWGRSSQAQPTSHLILLLLRLCFPSVYVYGCMVWSEEQPRVRCYIGREVQKKTIVSVMILMVVFKDCHKRKTKIVKRLCNLVTHVNRSGQW